MPEKPVKSNKKVKNVPTIFSETHRLLKRSLFRFGFECEFVFDSEKIQFENLGREFRTLHSKMVVDGDGSIYGDGRFKQECGMEVKTPPLFPNESFILLEKVFVLIDKYGYTNKTCGLHVNFSPANNNLYYAINPFTFSKEKLWEKIRRDFKRQSNSYCVKTEFGLNKKKTPFQWFQALRDGVEIVSTDHYHVVNFENYYGRRHSDARIEVRAFGNADYQKRFNDVINYSEEILRLFMKNCDRKKIALI